MPEVNMQKGQGQPKYNTAVTLYYYHNRGYLSFFNTVLNVETKNPES